jgi:hypothetical protein
VESDQKKEPVPVATEKREDEPAETKKPEVEIPDDPRYDILTTLEGACFQSRFPFDKMTT